MPVACPVVAFGSFEPEGRFLQSLGDGENERDGLLSGGDRRPVGRVAGGDAELGGVVEVEIVESDAGPGDHLQPRSSLVHGAVVADRGAHDGAVRLFDAFQRVSAAHIDDLRPSVEQLALQPAGGPVEPDDRQIVWTICRLSNRAHVVPLTSETASDRSSVWR